MIKRTPILLIILTVMSAAALGLSIYTLYKNKKTGYVDTIKLFNEYRMKLDLEQEEAQVLEAIKHEHDSLRMLYEVAVKNPEAKKECEQLSVQIRQMQEMFETEYDRSNQDINEKVWKRLNPDIDVFARERKLDLLMGANGMGTILYGKPDKDFTKELLDFVNKKYLNEH